MKILTNTKEWKALVRHYKKMRNTHIRTLFDRDKNRGKEFLIRDDKIGVLLDYSKNIVTHETIKLLVNLSKKRGLNQMIKNMFNGDKINWTEKRAVLHTALRDFSNKRIMVDGVDVTLQIRRVLKKMKRFSSDVRLGKWTGATGREIKNIVNIGIGGSDLGPSMVCEALKYYADGPNVYFVSNVDSSHIMETLKSLNPTETLFMIASKTFTTQETMKNANTAKKWVVSALGDKAIPKHFVAISTNKIKVKEFGIDANNMFEFWDFVGGRYSLWSAIGLPIACYIGFNRFKELLYGAYLMDEHFKNIPLNKNIPCILALLGIWYNNFFGSQTYAILPYSQYLHRLPAYLQQADMESNGKIIDINGKRVNYDTGPIIWGQAGTNGQHSFYQLIHQGTRLIPADFIGFIKPLNNVSNHHNILVANFFAQTKALAFGLNRDEVIENMKNEGLTRQKINMLAPYRSFEGNKPTNSILFNKLTPRTLGSLIAMYEHKIFVQGVIWGINSFDQWGVELGKKLAREILKELTSGKIKEDDSSTRGLLRFYMKKKNIK